MFSANIDGASFYNTFGLTLYILKVDFTSNCQEHIYLRGFNNFKLLLVYSTYMVILRSSVPSIFIWSKVILRRTKIKGST